MTVSLAWLPEDGDKPNAGYLHGLIDGSTVFDIGATAFRQGNYKLVQDADVGWSGASEPFLAAGTAVTCGGQSVSLGSVAAYSFSGCRLVNYGLGWYADLYKGFYPAAWEAGLIVRVAQARDLRAGKTRTKPWHGVPGATLTSSHVHWPLAVLDEDSTTASFTVRACLMGMTRAWIFNPDSGHTMAPGQPLASTGETPYGYLRNYDASAYSMPAGLFCGVLCGHSVDATLALLPIQFWPYGLVRWPTEGQIP